MKNRFVPPFIASLLTAALVLALSACGQKKDDNSGAAVNGNNRTSGTTSAPQNPGNWVEQSIAALPGSPNLETNVKNLLAATWDPAGIGQITTGARESFLFSGYLEMPTNGAMNAPASRLRIWVTDSYAFEKQEMGSGAIALPYYIEFKNAVSGSVSGNSFNAVFKDDYQQITLSGTFTDAGPVNGTLSFSNLKDATNSGLKSGTIQFVLASSCSLFNCRHR